MSEPFLGEIRVVSFQFAPRGWASCDGALLPIAQNQALFALLGTTWGGDGRVTFRLPNLTGQPMVGASSVDRVGPQTATQPPHGGTQPALSLHFIIALTGIFPSRS